jgi:hypothetical protein
MCCEQKGVRSLPQYADTPALTGGPCLGPFGLQPRAGASKTLPQPTWKLLCEKSERCEAAARAALGGPVKVSLTCGAQARHSGAGSASAAAARGGLCRGAWQGPRAALDAVLGWSGCTGAARRTLLPSGVTAVGGGAAGLGGADTRGSEGLAAGGGGGGGGGGAGCKGGAQAVQRRKASGCGAAWRPCRRSAPKRQAGSGLTVARRRAPWAWAAAARGARWAWAAAAVQAPLAWGPAAWAWPPVARSAWRPAWAALGAPPAWRVPAWAS